MERYRWEQLTKQQLGKFAEYFVKMELTMYGFQVFGTEVDERGIDFIARFEHGPFLQVQVKSVRGSGYVYMEKTKFELHEHLLLAFALLVSGEPPSLFLIPSTTWSSCEAHDLTFVDREYGNGLKSAPEWGMNVSKKNLPKLQQFSFDKTVAKLIEQAKRNVANTDHL